MLTSKINVCAFRETETLNNVSERSSFILVSFVSVDRKIFTFAEMSYVFRCASQKSTLYHDPDCAMSLFVLLLTPTHLLSQNCRRTQPCTFVFVQKCRRPLPNRGRRTHTRNVGSPNTSSRGAVLNNACTSVLCSFDATRLMADCCLASLVSAIDTVILRFCFSSSNASPSFGAGSCQKILSV